ncbi:hypothetical protein PPECC9_47070 [Escherichia coli PCN009]|nr:hypothetical protein [Escherichia coli]OAF88616.1 hypothetical protein PPECC9_47070 [Escherichia coli PCN009]
MHIKSHPEQLRNDYYLTSKVTFNFFLFPLIFVHSLSALPCAESTFFFLIYPQSYALARGPFSKYCDVSQMK